MSRSILAIVAAILLALAGCAGPVKGTFTYGALETPAGKTMTWPRSDVETPRYMYAGELIGEKNFTSAANTAAGNLKSFISWLGDVIAGEGDIVELRRPAAVTVDGAGRILVTDLSYKAVFVFDAKAGQLDIWDRGSRTEAFEAPNGIVVSAAGEAYIADANAQKVFVLDAKGKPLRVIGGPEVFSRPIGLAWDEAGQRLFVADAYAHAIKVLDREGKLLATWGSRGEGPGEFNYPAYLALGNGRLYVTDVMNARIQALDSTDGKPLAAFGKRGLYEGDLVRPKGVATDSEGNIYVAESYFDKLLIFNRRGDYLMSIGGNGTSFGEFFQPAGLWIDRQNRVHVADMFNGRISIYQYLGAESESE